MDVNEAIRAKLEEFCSDWCAEKGKAAILDVLDLHIPETVDYIDRDGQERSSDECEVCGSPGGVPDAWPCPTVMAIAKVFEIEP